MYTIDELGYKLYKEDWKNSHTTHEQRMESLRNWYENTEGEGYLEYLDENGFNGELYACYEEFLNNEFRDMDYMEGLFKTGSLKEQYEEYISEMGFER